MRVRSFIAGLGIATVTLFGVGVGSAAAQEPIGPNQHFLGLVNGSNNDPAVYVVCPGPVAAGRTGPVAGGQTMSVAQVSSGGGYTGLFSMVNSWFVPVPASSAAKPTELRFTEYGVPQNIPTSIQVPLIPLRASISAPAFRSARPSQKIDFMPIQRFLG